MPDAHSVARSLHNAMPVSVQVLPLPYRYSLAETVKGLIVPPFDYFNKQEAK